MSDKSASLIEAPTDEHKEKYYSFQIKGWTKFDPMDKTLTKIAENITRGGGFLTLVEVVQVENDLATIGDEEVRECFANILAAERLVKNLHTLPNNLIEELRSALEGDDDASKKSVASVASLPLKDAKRW